MSLNNHVILGRHSMESQSEAQAC